ncbi:MAG: heme ABC exporter ATP-binding protein CcmA [Anaerolineae bacterium]|nr:heme ABC exporter ATP-binding protein CcmA [Anaerolineae bacterium]
MIVVRDLVKTFGYFPVLRNLDLDVAQGQCIALLGSNGSGKSTLLRILAALSRPTAGTVTIAGWELPNEAAAVRRQLGVVSHLPLLYDTLTAQENLRFFGELYDLGDEALAERIRAVLERVGLVHRANDQVRTFSRGMLQRLTIARAILHDPALILFDEPYTGLDQDAGRILDELLLDLRGEGRTIIMTTHDILRAHRLVTHLAILSRGKIGYFGASEAVPAAEVISLYTEITGAVK